MEVTNTMRVSGDAPALRAEDVLEEVHRAPADHAEPAAVQQVDDQRDRRRGQPAQQEDVQERHARLLRAPR